MVVAGAALFVLESHAGLLLELAFLTPAQFPAQLPALAPGPPLLAAAAAAASMRFPPCELKGVCFLDGIFCRSPACITRPCVIGCRVPVTFTCSVRFMDYVLCAVVSSKQEKLNWRRAQ